LFCDLGLDLDLQLYAGMGVFGLEYDLTRVFALVIVSCGGLLGLNWNYAGWAYSEQQADLVLGVSLS